MSIGNLPEIMSQRILVGIILVGRSGVVEDGYNDNINNNNNSTNDTSREISCSGGDLADGRRGH